MLFKSLRMQYYQASFLVHFACKIVNFLSPTIASFGRAIVVYGLPDQEDVLLLFAQVATASSRMSRVEAGSGSWCQQQRIS
jgi:hypothetical protein